MNENTRIILERIGRERGTPCYVYMLDGIIRRFRDVRSAFGGRFEISYAVKANPNRELLVGIVEETDTLDVSAIGEMERARQAGYAASRITFSGPAKRVTEIESAVQQGCGEIVCESLWEIETLDHINQQMGRVTPFLIRINPARVPRKFGVRMAGQPSQFGIDEEEMPATLRRLPEWSNLAWRGFHIYSGTNCLNADAIAENFGIFIELFERFSRSHDLRPRKLIFGSGFGIPYHVRQHPLDLVELADSISPQIDQMRREPHLEGAVCTLEMGRYLVGPEGYLLTSVINEKRSRGTDIRICDAGFNNHLAAWGMMGTVIRRNWPIRKVNTDGSASFREYMLTGPLCTTIDILASRIELPELRRGDILAIESSGAYGLTASPTRFISHPEPREFIVIGSGGSPEIVDATNIRSESPTS